MLQSLKHMAERRELSHAGRGSLRMITGFLKLNLTKLIEFLTRTHRWSNLKSHHSRRHHFTASPRRGWGVRCAGGERVSRSCLRMPIHRTCISLLRSFPDDSRNLLHRFALPVRPHNSLIILLADGNFQSNSRLCRVPPLGLLCPLLHFPRGYPVHNSSRACIHILSCPLTLAD